MKIYLLLIAIFFLVHMSCSPSIAQSGPSRKALLDVMLTSQQLSQIEIKEITMVQGQTAPKHSHPCVVVGYVSSGRVLFQIEGEEKRIIEAGEAFYEPKDKIVLHFDNDSTDQPLTFIAFYLKQADEELVKIIK